MDPAKDLPFHSLNIYMTQGTTDMQVRKDKSSLIYEKQLALLANPAAGNDDDISFFAKERIKMYRKGAF